MDVRHFHGRCRTVAESHQQTCAAARTIVSTCAAPDSANKATKIEFPYQDACLRAMTSTNQLPADVHLCTCCVADLMARKYLQGSCLRSSTTGLLCRNVYRSTYRCIQYFECVVKEFFVVPFKICVTVFL